MIPRFSFPLFVLIERLSAAEIMHFTVSSSVFYDIMIL